MGDCPCPSLPTLLGLLLSGALVLFAIRKPKLLYVLFKTIPRDAQGIVRGVKFAVMLGIIQLQQKSVGTIFDSVAKKYAKKVCYYFEDKEWTFKDVNDLANKTANYFAAKGLVKGDAVALFMENRPEYICIWVGLSKIGVVPALINTNLRLHPLHHSLAAVDCKAIIYGKELTSAVEEILTEKYVAALPLYCSGQGTEKSLPNALNLDEELKNVSTKTPKPISPVTFNDKLFYIYTSGTTGLPKAAVIKHGRYAMITVGSHYLQDVRTSDVVYTTMPLYHSAAGILGIGHSLFYGTSILLKKKFSARNFWTDCIKYDVTVCQYIGEICRYLLSQPERPEDSAHKVRLMIGNGLRPDIWAKFVTRFSIKHIAELYGSTEGNCNIVNVDGKVGAVGFVPRWIYPIFFMKLVKVDKDGEPIRDPKTGFLIPCKPNEPGELVAKINHGHPFRDFQGYADSSSKKKKIMTDAFKKGDAVFRSGDILVMDQYGYFYFKDRQGDTFRWKGENVSTAEVEAIISRICGLKDAVVYGVQVPGADGRAGMAAIADPDGTLNLEELAAGAAKELPSYARPLFVRTMKHIDMTGTFKMKKSDLQAEGYDISKVGADNIYLFLNGNYVLLDQTMSNDIQSGKIRL
jgi:solute carrier family 27 fatty acid transporter 1/4